MHTRNPAVLLGRGELDQFDDVWWGRTVEINREELCKFPGLYCIIGNQNRFSFNIHYIGQPSQVIFLLDTLFTDSP